MTKVLVALIIFKNCQVRKQSITRNSKLTHDPFVKVHINMNFLVQLLRLKSSILLVFILSGKDAKLRICEIGLTLKELENGPMSKVSASLTFHCKLLNSSIALADI